MEAENPTDDLQESANMSENQEQESSSMLEPQSPGDADESQYEDASSQLEGVEGAFDGGENSAELPTAENGENEEDVLGQEVHGEDGEPESDAIQVQLKCNLKKLGRAENFYAQKKKKKKHFTNY